MVTDSQFTDSPFTNSNSPTHRFNSPIHEFTNSRIGYQAIVSRRNPTADRGARRRRRYTARDGRGAAGGHRRPRRGTSPAGVLLRRVRPRASGHAAGARSDRRSARPAARARRARGRRCRDGVRRDFTAGQLSDRPGHARRPGRLRRARLRRARSSASIGHTACRIRRAPRTSSRARRSGPPHARRRPGRGGPRPRAGTGAAIAGRRLARGRRRTAAGRARRPQTPAGAAGGHGVADGRPARDRRGALTGAEGTRRRAAGRMASGAGPCAPGARRARQPPRLV